MSETLAEHLSIAYHLDDLAETDGGVTVTVGDNLPVRLKVSRL